MTPERWRQVEEVLRREVELLLAQQASIGGFLEDPAGATAAQMGSETGASVLTGRRLGVYQVHARIGAGANIKITPDGLVKVLDFGLAKAASADAAPTDLTQAPTITVGGTQEGVILVTPRT